MTRHCAGSTGPPSASCVLSRGHCDLFLQILTRRCACKRRTEASHRTLRCQVGQNMPSLPQQASCADFPAGHGQLGMPTKVAFLTHMVGNQDPFLHCLQLVSVLSKTFPLSSFVSTSLDIQSRNTLPCLCSADCSITSYYVFFYKNHKLLRYQRVYRF